MITINLKNLGKRFNKEWIFKEVNETLSSKHNYVILGRNGSGKSTFLQTIAGKYEYSEGGITYQIDDSIIEIESIYKKISICAPYLDLYEDFTLVECIEFHFQFKQIINNIKFADIPALIGLEKSKNKQIRYFSSGMKQRVKLGLAILSHTPILFLDEPTNNLDHEAIEWYQSLVKNNSENRLIMVCSNNQPHEFVFCDKTLQIEDFKPIRK